MTYQESTTPDVPLLKPKPRKVPFGFSKPDNPVLIDQILLAKDNSRED